MEALLKTYFDCFNRHSIDDLSDLLDKNVSLSDWSVSAEGLQNVLSAIRQIFRDHPDISVAVQSVSIVDTTAFIEIQIDIGDGKQLDVLDVINVTQDPMKILGISAYRKF